MDGGGSAAERNRLDLTTGRSICSWGVEALYGPLILWAIQHWQRPGQSLPLALDTTVLDNRFCVVVIALLEQAGVVCSLQGQALRNIVAL